MYASYRNESRRLSLPLSIKRAVCLSLAGLRESVFLSLLIGTSLRCCTQEAYAELVWINLIHEALLQFSLSTEPTAVSQSLYFCTSKAKAYLWYRKASTFVLVRETEAWVHPITLERCSHIYTGLGCSRYHPLHTAAYVNVCWRVLAYAVARAHCSALCTSIVALLL